MDISEIDNVDQLKALAYDQLVLLEQVQGNLRTINGRIAALSAAQQQYDASNGVGHLSDRVVETV